MESVAIIDERQEVKMPSFNEADISGADECWEALPEPKPGYAKKSFPESRIQALPFYEHSAL